MTHIYLFGVACLLSGIAIAVTDWPIWVFFFIGMGIGWLANRVQRKLKAGGA